MSGEDYTQLKNKSEWLLLRWLVYPLKEAVAQSQLIVARVPRVLFAEPSNCKQISVFYAL